MATRPKQIHGTRTRDSLDKAFLVIAFTVGAVGIIGLKQVDIEPWWAAAFSAFVLLSYAIAAWINRNLALEPEVIGDNCYYLGFIFTLISLAVTLYQMIGTGTDASILRNVVAGFGVALSSTIVGVFLRVFMMQLRTDIVSRDRQARLELNDAGREFRVRLAESVAQIKAFSTEAVQLASETNTRIQQANEAFHDAHRQLIEKTTEQYSRTLSDLMAASAAIITRDLKASIDEVLSEFREEVSASLEHLRSATLETSRLQRTEAEEQASRIAQAAVETKRSHDTLQAWNALLQKITKDATQTSEAVQDAARRISDGVSQAVGGVETAVDQLEEVLALRRIGPALDETVAALTAAAARIGRLAGEIEKNLPDNEHALPGQGVGDADVATPTPPYVLLTEGRVDQ